MAGRFLGTRNEFPDLFGVTNCGGKGGGDLDEQIHTHLFSAGGTHHLRDLRKLFGKKGDPQDHNHPVNKAMVRLRDAGKVKVHGGERGEPYFSAH